MTTAQATGVPLVFSEDERDGLSLSAEGCFADARNRGTRPPTDRVGVGHSVGLLLA